MTDGERAQALLTYANYAKVGEALRVSRASVAEWAKGRSVTPYRLRQLEQLLRPDIETEEARPPQWAAGLEARLVTAIGAALTAGADGNAAELLQAFEDRYASLLAALQQQLSVPGRDPE